jgi:hypothetical protein
VTRSTNARIYFSLDGDWRKAADRWAHTLETMRIMTMKAAGLIAIVTSMLAGLDSFAGSATNGAAFPPLALPGPGGYDPAVAALDSCNRGGRNVLADVYLINTVVSECQQNRTVQARDSGISGRVSTCWSYTSQWTNLELQGESIEQQASKTSDGRAAGALMQQAQATLDQARSILIAQAVCTNGLINSDQFAANDGTNRNGGTNGGTGNNGGGGTNASPSTPTASGGGGGDLPGPRVNNQSPMPGPAGGIGYRPGPNACLPQGPGGYDYCQNGPGARLPPGCSCGGTQVAQNKSPPTRGGYVDSHDTVKNNPKEGGLDGTTVLFGNTKESDPGVASGNPNSHLAAKAQSNNTGPKQVNPAYTGQININGSPKLILVVTAPRGWHNGQVLTGRPKPLLSKNSDGTPNYPAFDWAQATIEEVTDQWGERVVTAKVTRVRLVGSGPGTEDNKDTDYPLFEQNTDSWNRNRAPFVIVPLKVAPTPGPYKAY